MKKHYVIVLKSGYEVHVTTAADPIKNHMEHIASKDSASATAYYYTNTHTEVVCIITISEIAAIYLATAKEMEGT